MKTVKITMTLTVTDEYFETELKKMKNEILCGKYQREIKEGYSKRKGDAVEKVTMTFEEIK